MAESLAIAELLGAAEVLDWDIEEEGAIDSLESVPEEQAVNPTVATAISPRAAANFRFMRFMSFSLAGGNPWVSAFALPLLVRAVMKHSVPR
ncbi:hypothetical protein [Paeniglutamicibacter antarcticus]|uniref:Uncharacterized protein n=1 Tax=Paeniglutamicibacter antarcticus TaxID=494023 RepID=A0ABP9TIX1_9MICC